MDEFEVALVIGIYNDSYMSHSSSRASTLEEYEISFSEFIAVYAFTLVILCA